MAHQRSWSRDEEQDFFTKALEITSPERLFYITNDKRYLAYWTRNYEGKKDTLQSSNTYIGNHTENWTKELLEDIAKEVSAFTVTNVICEEIALSNYSQADVAICRTEEKVQIPENILIVIEVKMSIVWNWEYEPLSKELKCIGDYTPHSGDPGLLRSDTMLKAIGKSTNIRVASHDLL